MEYILIVSGGDFPDGSVVKNPPSNRGDVSSISGQGTKIPRTAKQLNPCAATIEPKPQLEKTPCVTNKTWCSKINNNNKSSCWRMWSYHYESQLSQLKSHHQSSYAPRMTSAHVERASAHVEGCTFSKVLSMLKMSFYPSFCSTAILSCCLPSTLLLLICHCILDQR